MYGCRRLRAAPVRCPSPSRGHRCRSLPPCSKHALNDRAPDRQGKVRDIYDFGDALLIVATDRISAFDYVLGSGIPDKGKVLTQLSAFWFERTRHIVANHLLVDRRRDVSGRRCAAADVLRGRSMLVRKTDAGADRVRGARLPVGLGLEGLSGDRRGLRHRAARRAARVGSAARADLHAGHQGAERPRHQHQRSRGGDAGRRASSIARLRDLTLRSTPTAPRTPRRCGIILADTKFEFGLLTDDGETSS